MALGLFFSLYAYAVSVGSIRRGRLRDRFASVYNLFTFFTKLHMHSNTIRNAMGEKALIIFMHFTDLLIGGGLIGGFIASIGDWQAGIYLGVFIMFAVLRGASLLEDIHLKREKRRREKIENDHADWENRQKRKLK